MIAFLFMCAATETATLPRAHTVYRIVEIRSNGNETSDGITAMQLGLDGGAER